jgi:hypothetical protein
VRLLRNYQSSMFLLNLHNHEGFLDGSAGHVIRVNEELSSANRGGINSTSLSLPPVEQRGL